MSKTFVTNVKQAIGLSHWQPTVHEVEIEWLDGNGSDWFLLRTISHTESKQLNKLSGTAEMDRDDSGSIKIDLAAMDASSDADWLKICMCADKHGTPFFNSDDELNQFMQLHSVLGTQLALKARQLNRRKKVKEAKNA